MENFIKRWVEKLRGEDNEIKVKEIEYPPAYYEKTRDLKENLRMYEEVVKKIKAEYEPYSLETAFKNTFGEEFSDVDFIYRDRIEAYCERNNVSEEQLHELEKTTRPLRNKVSKIISERIEREKGWVLYKDGQDLYEDMLKAIKKGEEPERMKGVIRSLQDARKKKKEDKVKEDARFLVLRATMSVIVNNINPYGREPEAKFQEDWVRQIDFVEKKLCEKGLDLKAFGNNEEIKEAWAEISHQVKNERSARLYSWNLQEYDERAQGLKKETAECQTTERGSGEREPR
ncbi:MAG: hypothetical protein PHV56_06925 [Clostridia bacterium]|nr:hypothetical protein [Clostridia bacterium]